MIVINQQQEKTMIEIKYQIEQANFGANYGFKNGDWVNSYAYEAIIKFMKSKGEEIPCIQGQAIFNNGVMIKIKKDGVMITATPDSLMELEPDIEENK